MQSDRVQPTLWNKARRALLTFRRSPVKASRFVWRQTVGRTLLSLRGGWATAPFVLHRAGFYSEINNLLTYLTCCRLQKVEPVVDHTFFSYAFDQGLHDYFALPGVRHLLPFDRELMQEAPWSRTVGAFVPMRRREGVLSILGLTEEAFLEELRISHDYFFELRSDTQKSMNDRIPELQRPYLGLHIRRQDKLFSEIAESEETELDTIVELVRRVAQERSLRDVYLATDDVPFAKELGELMPELHFITPESKFVRKGLADCYAASGEEIQMHTHELLAEVEMLVRADTFVGMYTSNIGLYVAMRRKQIRCHSYEGEFDWWFDPIPWVGPSETEVPSKGPE